jgi:hypothetical protein
MTHKIKDAVPEPCGDKKCTHKHIVAESITVKSPGEKGSVSIMGSSGTTGIWVQTGNGQECVGLIAQRGVGPALVIYGEKGGNPTAISGDTLQLPDAENPSAATQIPLKDLVEAVRQAVKAKPQGV